MSEPFLAEINMFASNFAPRGWAFCDGQLLAIAQHTALFSLLGTIYGGDGRTSFALPDLRSRSPKHAGQGPGLRRVQLGERSGREEVTLTTNEMPSHSHTATLHGETAAPTTRNPTNRLLAGGVTYADSDDNSATNVAFSPEAITVSSVGGGQSFSISNPYLGVNFIIALEGVFPSRS